MAQTTLETLKNMRTLLSEPKSWLQGNFAAKLFVDPRNPGKQIPVWIDTSDPFAEGYVESWLREDAQCFCLIGAGLRVTQAHDWKGFLRWESEIQQTLEQLGRGQSIPYFNDLHDTTHKDVLQVLDQTIARVEEEENAPKCPKCGTPFEKLMWYSCNLDDCPSGLGSDVTMKV